MKWTGCSGKQNVTMIVGEILHQLLYYKYEYIKEKCAFKPGKWGFQRVGPIH